jgi:hypothetical protein
MNTPARQTTFQSYSELLNRAAQDCRSIGNDLRRHARAAAEERATLILQQVAETEHELADTLQSFCSMAPDGLLNTRTQYQFEPENAAEPQVIDDAVKLVLEINQQIGETFGDQADKMTAPGVSELLDNVRQAVHGANKRITEIRETAQDV